MTPTGTNSGERRKTFIPDAIFPLEIMEAPITGDKVAAIGSHKRYFPSSVSFSLLIDWDNQKCVPYTCCIKYQSVRDN